jgi:hypothetical protein
MDQKQHPAMAVSAMASAFALWVVLTYYNIFGDCVAFAGLWPSIGLAGYVQGFWVRVMVAGLGLLIPSVVVAIAKASKLNTVAFWGQLNRIEADVQAIKTKVGA